MAPTRSTVLITGESGTGKTQLACAIAEFIPEYKLSDVGGALAILGMKEIAARVQTLTGAVFDKGRVSEAA